jgi:hypothetical protein
MRGWILILSLMMAAWSATANLAVVGPEVLTRTTGSPQTFERQLPPLNPNAEYTLIIKNGVVPADRVSSASVVLDGVEIFGPNAFNKTVAILSRTVRLKSTGSTLRIVIAGGPGSFLEVSILAPFEAYTLVPATGGTAAVTNPNSPIAGTAVKIPEEAVPPGGLAVTIGFTETPPAPLPPASSLASKVFTFEAGATTNFPSPVAVTVPVQGSFAPNEIPVVLYWSPTEQKYKPISPKSFDRNAGLVTFETSHFSTYAVASFNPASVTTKIDTGFRVGVNSLRRTVGNTGTATQFAAALYSQWYFLNKPTGTFGSLFDQYVQSAVANPSDLLISEELMMRLSVPLTPSWQSVQAAPGIPVRQATDDLIAALALSGEPQILMLQSAAAGSATNFFVLVYSWDPQTGTFEIYDTATPGSNLTIFGDRNAAFLTLRVGQSPFPPFAPLEVNVFNLRHVGGASLITGPELEGYFQGAAAGWATPPYSRIRTPPDYISVLPGIVTPLSGSVQQSTHAVSRLEVFYRGLKVNTVDVDGANQYTLNYVPPGSTQNEVWLVGSQAGSPVWNDKCSLRQVPGEERDLPNPVCLHNQSISDTGESHANSHRDDGSAWS